MAWTMEEPSSIPGNGNIIFPTHASTPALKPITTGTGGFLLSLNQLDREADRSHPSCAYIKICGAKPPLP